MVKAVILGVGARGAEGYGKYSVAHPDELQITALCDINPIRNEKYGTLFNVPKDKWFSDVNDLYAQGKLGDVIFICTQDRDHFEHAKKAIELGYDILLEKPISPVFEECLQLERLAKQYGRKIILGHVLRYTIYFQTIKKIIDSGRLGKIIAINQIENVEFWHMAHSFVRGNWRNSLETSPMILQKCCHDFDILYWLTNSRCKQLSSYGELHLFKSENAPDGSSTRCTKGCKCKDECPYNAETIYVKNFKNLNISDEEKLTRWPYCQVITNATVDRLQDAIDNGPYGRCVYHCDNNVVDHQVVNMVMDNGVICNLTMAAFTRTGGRQVKVMGTLGDIIADENEMTIRVGIYGQPLEFIDVRTLATDFSGHGGGDNKLVADFIDTIAKGGEMGLNHCVTTIENSIEGHVMAFAAEWSRLHNGESLDCHDFKANYESKYANK